MRKSLWIMLAVLLAAIVAPSAQADSFTVDFTTTGCTAPCLLPSAADVMFPSPTTMDVTFDGLMTAVTIPAGDAAEDLYSWSAFAFSSTLEFALVDVTKGAESILCSPAFSAPTLSCGTLTFAPVATTPEPSSVALMLLGVVLLFVMRKRIGQGLPQAS